MCVSDLPDLSPMLSGQHPIFTYYMYINIPSCPNNYTMCVSDLPDLAPMLSGQHPIFTYYMYINILCCPNN